MADFSLFIKQCYHIVGSVEKMLKIKMKNCKDKILNNNVFIRMCSVW